MYTVLHASTAVMLTVVVIAAAFAPSLLQYTTRYKYYKGIDPIITRGQ